MSSRFELVKTDYRAATLIDKRNQKFEDAVDELLVSCAAQVCIPA